jgi:hypothetical protein
MHWKPIYEAVDDFLALPDDNPYKIEGLKYYKDFKNFETRNKFTRYLKLLTGAYDPYRYYFLWEDGSWDDRSAPRKLTDEAKFFPNVVKWVEQTITDGIFKNIGRVIFFCCDVDGVAFEHRDLDFKNGVLSNDEYNPYVSEFIHIRPNTERPFYIWDPATKSKTYLNTRAAWWNDQDWHGGDRIMKESYALRIDGQFTEEFKSKLLR